MGDREVIYLKIHFLNILFIQGARKGRPYKDDPDQMAFNKRLYRFCSFQMP